MSGSSRISLCTCVLKESGSVATKSMPAAFSAPTITRAFFMLYCISTPRCFSSAMSPPVNSAKSIYLGGRRFSTLCSGAMSIVCSAEIVAFFPVSSVQVRSSVSITSSGMIGVSWKSGATCS